MKKTVEQIQYERDSAKQQKLNAILSKYRIKKERDAVKRDQYYNDKAEREYRSWEKRFDKTTERLKKHAQTIEEIKQISTDKSRTKAKDKKKLEKLVERSKKLEKPLVKEKRKKKTTYKQLAFQVFQLYSKIYRADDDGYVVKMDNGETVYYTKAQ